MPDNTRETGTPTVVLVSGETDIANQFASWLGKNYTVHVAPDSAAADSFLDKTVDVVVVDRTRPAGAVANMLSTVRKKDLDCQVAIITGEEPDIDVREMDFDDYLCKPVSKEELLDTVKRLLAQATYRKGIEELYTLTREKSLVELDSSTDSTATEQYERLQARFEELDEELTEIMKTFSKTQLTAELAQLSSEATEK